MKIEKSLGGDFMRLPEGQEGAGLSMSGVRQKDPRTLSWVKNGQVDTAKSLRSQKNPTFSGEYRYFRLQETLCR